MPKRSIEQAITKLGSRVRDLGDALASAQLRGEALRALVMELLKAAYHADPTWLEQRLSRLETLQADPRMALSLPFVDEQVAVMSAALEQARHEARWLRDPDGRG